MYLVSSMRLLLIQQSFLVNRKFSLVFLSDALIPLYYVSLFHFIVSPSGGVRVSPLTFTASSGDNVSIECIAPGGPDNMLAWKFNGSVLSNGGRYTVTPFSLTIAGVVGEDHGLYTCEATNFAGIGISTSSLTGYFIASKY